MMGLGMSGSALDRIHPHDRVSIRAVLVHDGEDPGPALAAAGIFDPIAIPVVIGEHPPTSGMLGDGLYAESDWCPGNRWAGQLRRLAHQPAQPGRVATWGGATG